MTNAPITEGSASTSASVAPPLPLRRLTPDRVVPPDDRAATEPPVPADTPDNGVLLRFLIQPSLP